MQQRGIRRLVHEAIGFPRLFADIVQKKKKVKAEDGVEREETVEERAKRKAEKAAKKAAKAAA
jgi:hypothetical protein